MAGHWRSRNRSAIIDGRSRGFAPPRVDRSRNGAGVVLLNMISRMSRSLCALSFTSLLVAIAACSRAAAPPPAAIGGTKAVDPATTGVVVGRVAFDGTPPAPEPLRMQTDKSCLQG